MAKGKRRGAGRARLLRPRGRRGRRDPRAPRARAPEPGGLFRGAQPRDRGGARPVGEPGAPVHADRRPDRLRRRVRHDDLDVARLAAAGGRQDDRLDPALRRDRVRAHHPARRAQHGRGGGAVQRAHGQARHRVRSRATATTRSASSCRPGRTRRATVEQLLRSAGAVEVRREAADRVLSRRVGRPPRAPDRLRRLRLLVQPGAVARRSLARDPLVRPHDPARSTSSRTRRAAVPRYTPAGTVPVTGGEPDWSDEWTTGKTTTADALKNPYAADAAENQGAASPGPDVSVIPRDVDAAGDTLFQTYCAVCHGSAGDAKGPVSSRIGAPSLLTGRARGVLRRLHLQHHPLRPRRHAALRRQGLPAQRPLGHREPRPQAPGPGAARTRAGGRRGRDPAGAERHRLDRGEAPMSATLHERLVQRAVAGRYDLFLGVGGGCTMLGLILFVIALAVRAGRPRLAALPRELAVLHRPGRRAAWRSWRCRRSPTPSGRA